MNIALMTMCEQMEKIYRETWGKMTESEWLASTDPQAMLRFATHADHNNAWHHKRPSDRKLYLFCCACCYGVSAALGKDAEQCVELKSVPAKNPVIWAIAWAGDQKQPTPEERANFLRDIVGNPFQPVSLCGNPDHGSVTVRPYCAACQSLRTPTVLAIAQAAYEERPGRKCEECVDGDVGCSVCQGAGIYYDPPYSLNRLKCPHCNDGLLPDKCRHCSGTGRIEDGSLDPVTLAILADALEDVGCTNEHILRHLRGYRPCQFCCGNFTDPPERHAGAITGLCVQCLDDHGWERSPGPHVRGCWVLDLILGKE